MHQAAHPPYAVSSVHLRRLVWHPDRYDACAMLGVCVVLSHKLHLGPVRPAPDILPRTRILCETSPHESPHHHPLRPLVLRRRRRRGKCTALFNVGTTCTSSEGLLADHITLRPPTPVVTECSIIITLAGASRQVLYREGRDTQRFKCASVKTRHLSPRVFLISASNTFPPSQQEEHSSMIHG